MKKYLKYIAVGVAAVSVASCADLDTEPLGSTVTPSQKEDAIVARPSLGSAGVTAISANYHRMMAVSENHYDFGYPAVMLGLDLQTADMNSGYNGYNWFQSWQGYVNPTPTAVPTAMAWYTMYQTIKVANDVVSQIPADAEDLQMQYFRGQGLANRAFCYWVLANLYQFNYQHVDPATAPCVPLVLDTNVAEVTVNGAPRATVEAVYTQIMEDIDEAITLIEGSGIDASKVIASKPKRYISTAAAYGLRARFNLSMGKYTDAANDAQSAISKFAGQPYSIYDVSVPGFNNIEDTSWMWGIAVSETDDGVRLGLVNFPSHICSFAYGYVTVGAWRFCAEDLYESIPSTDVRKGWFLDSSYYSPNLSEEQQAYLNGYKGNWVLDSYNTLPYIFPYTNVKYGPYQGKLGQTINASDVPMMRVEEMYLILAEAQAMSGADGKGTLEAFIQTYRDPKYTCKAATPEEIQEEVFQQRRVELWGEGLVYFDYMRLNKGVDRTNAMAPNIFKYKIEPKDPVLIYCIPEGEITGNKQLSASDNNPSSSRPTPIVVE